MLLLKWSHRSRAPSYELLLLWQLYCCCLAEWCHQVYLGIQIFLPTFPNLITAELEEPLEESAAKLDNDLPVFTLDFSGAGF